MAAVSLEDAWTNASQPMITAKEQPTNPSTKAQAAAAAKAKPKDEYDEKNHLALLALIKENHAIYDEIIALRSDETRRSTMYLIFGSVLFAILFIYIDRLQGHVKTLNKLLIHPHQHTTHATEYLQSPAHIQVRSRPAWYA